MICWQKFAIPLLLLVLACAGAKEKAKTDTSADLFFSHEDKEPDYSDEHDSDEIDKPEKKEPKLDIARYKVCRSSKVDFCACDKSINRVDCRNDIRNLHANGVEVLPLENAAITVESPDFKPKYVYLTKNQIRWLDQETTLPDMTDSVEGIDFSFNNIDFIDEGAFDKFVKLRKLRLNHNWLKLNKSIDGWITPKLGKTLEELNLAYNSLNTINDGVFDPLHKLKKLILDGNTGLHLTGKTFGDKGLTSLETISLDNCGLDKLDPDVFKYLPELKFVSLIKNQLTSVPVATLKNVPKLHTLDLSENDIETLEKNSFKDLRTIVKLFLRAMPKVTKYGDCDFCGLTVLELIDFSGSKKLAGFDENAFGFTKNAADAPITSIKMVKLNNCTITGLNEKMLPWYKLDGLGLGGNPLNCDKNLEWLINDKNLHSFPGDVPTCDAPPEMKGKALQKIIKDAKNPSGVGSLFKTVFYMGLSVGTVGLILTGILFVNKRYDGNLVSTLFSRRRPDGVGFSNLNAEVGMENERVFDEDDNEFEPRPAAV